MSVHPAGGNLLPLKDDGPVSKGRIVREACDVVAYTNGDAVMMTGNAISINKDGLKIMADKIRIPKKIDDGKSCTASYYLLSLHNL